jgi:integrase
MASIKKFPRCQYWYACYKKFTGTFTERGRPRFKRVQQTTMLVDENEAERVALTLEGQSIKAAANQWNQSNGRALAQELQAIVGNSPTTFKTAAEFINGWLDRFNKSREKAAKTKKNYTSIVADLLTFLGPRAARPFGDFTTSLVVEFRNAQRDEGKAPATVNKALSVVRQICDEAIAAGVLTEHPFAVHGMRITLPRNTKARKRKHFKFAQFRKLVKATEPGATFKDGEMLSADWQTFIIVCGYTGGRQQEPAKLNWVQVDLNEGSIWLDVSKKDEEHYMPIHPTLRSHLEKIRPKNAEGYVMPEIAKQTPQTLSKVFREIILPRIGIVQEYHTRAENPEKGKGRVLAEYSLHSLRHSLSTWLNEAGVPDATRMALAGHEDEEVSLGYTHVEKETRAAAMGKIPSL